MAASNIYSLEPTTRGCVRLKTTAGDLLIDLFSRETPLAVRNFCQLAVDGAYKDKPFHRIVPGTLVQAGDEENDLSSFEDGQAFKDEFHSRLEFRGRGFVAMANEGRPNTNRSQFFITLKACPWLNRKHTIFGIIRGEPVFVAVKIGDSPQENEKALQPHKILSATIIEPPFPNEDIKPRHKQPAVDIKSGITMRGKEATKPTGPVTKGVTTLSFMDDDEEDSTLGITKRTPHALLNKASGSKDKKRLKVADPSDDSSSNDDEVEEEEENDARPEPPREATEQEKARDSRLAEKLAAFRAKRNL